MSVSAVAIAAGIAFGVVSWERHATTEAQSSALSLGKPVIAGNGETVPLNFPDGSRVVLASGTEAVVHELHEAGATVEVSRGEATISVRHQPKTNWLVDAGPYRVQVTGTRFSVGWTPEQGRFELTLAQGSVVVSAETGAHAAVTMVAPQSLVIDSTGWQLSRPGEASQEQTGLQDAGAVPVPSAMVFPPSGADSASSRHNTPTPRLHAGAGWEDLARQGKYAEAYDEASSHGLSQVADSRSSISLLSLAEACRFSGHGNEATQVLTRLRARFPGSDDAAIAAFQLGRYGYGATWFRTYLQERPNGALAQEASGRLLEGLSRAGDSAGANQAAEAYLARYPNGSHAAFARQLLGR